MAGTLTGIRFYKATTNTGTHVGSLWTSSGTLLAPRRSPTRPPPAGSRSTSPVPWRSTPTRPTWPRYLAPKGHYSATPDGFAGAVTNAPLTALSNTTSTNGVYSY